MTPTEQLAAAGESAPGIKHVMLNDVYAELEGGGSVTIEEIPEGDWVKAGEQVAGRAFGTVLLVELNDLTVDDSVMNTLHFHPDEDNRLAVIQRARRALNDAEAALVACGYVDYSGRRWCGVRRRIRLIWGHRPQLPIVVDTRRRRARVIRHAFEIGVDKGRAWATGSRY